MAEHWKQAALVLAGHGSARNPDSRLPTERLAAEIAARGLFAEVAACFLKEPPFIDEALSLVSAREVYVVPNFAGAGHITRSELPRALGLVGPLTRRDGRRIHYAEPVGSHPAIPGLLRKRIEAIIAGAALDRGDIGVLLIGHGSNRPGSSGTAESIAATLRGDGDYAQVVTAYLEQEPFVADWPTLVATPTVIAAPLLVAEGLHGSEDLPPLFGMPHHGTGPAQTHGRTVFLCRGIGSDPEIVEVILDRVAQCDARANQTG
jgi:sirohydrochlorin cobaltochelatase